jgi:tRNA G18 (ribose-2'-O)-methylase SpoU
MRKLKNEELNRATVEEFKTANKFPLVLVLDNIRSLSNIGSVFRTSDAFAVDELVLCGITAQPPHREIHKTALGATESVSWRYVESAVEAIQELKDHGYTILSVEQADKSVMLNEFYPDKNTQYALVFGNEVHGVDEAIISLSDACIEIPQWGTKHSLNVSVSAGIVLWDILFKLK